MKVYKVHFSSLLSKAQMNKTYESRSDMWWWPEPALIGRLFTTG